MGYPAYSIRTMEYLFHVLVVNKIYKYTTLHCRLFLNLSGIFGPPLKLVFIQRTNCLHKTIITNKHGKG